MSDYDSRPETQAHIVEWQLVVGQVDVGEDGK